MVRGTQKSPLSKLVSVPKKSFLHVTRLHPATTVEDVVDNIKQQFPEAECVKMKSKFPDSYASFKVGVFQTHLADAMLPEIWPDGVLVSKFF